MLRGLMNKATPSGSTDQQLNRHSRAMGAKLVAPLTAPHLIHLPRRSNCGPPWPSPNRGPLPGENSSCRGRVHFQLLNQIARLCPLTLIFSGLADNIDRQLARLHRCAGRQRSQTRRRLPQLLSPKCHPAIIACGCPFSMG